MVLYSKTFINVRLGFPALASPRSIAKFVSKNSIDTCYIASKTASRDNNKNIQHRQAHE
jgi:hypothetical protein